jgi:hypothetical protein
MNPEGRHSRRFFGRSVQDPEWPFAQFMFMGRPLHCRHSNDLDELTLRLMAGFLELVDLAARNTALMKKLD